MAKNGKKFMTRTEEYKVGFFGGPILKLEKKAFGWEYLGSDSHTEVEGIDVNTGKIQRKVIKTVYFQRTKPYTSNILFNLVEFISGIVSFFRRILANLSPLVLLAGFVVLFLGGDFSELATNIWTGIGIGYGVAIGSSLVLALLGWILKKVFRIKERLNEELEANGYETDD